VYYHIPAHVTGGEARKDAWCNTCYNAINGHIEVEGTKYGKNQLAKKKNDDDLEEPWVQCDYCNDWYHQICVLFNGRRNEGGEGTCVRLSQIRRHAVLSLTLVTVVHTSPNTRP
jgi:E1A/CREB-binding protein